MKPKLPTLLEVTGPRPVCFYCKKTLKPDTFWVEMLGHANFIPTIRELQEMPKVYFGLAAVQFGYQPDRVYRIVHGQRWEGEPTTTIHFWRGTYVGRGLGLGNDYDWPLFCGVEHALRFAAACWNAGMRMKEK